ncbi:MAG: group III truncated hemoglobin [Phycisphaerales bacterium JB054]
MSAAGDRTQPRHRLPLTEPLAGSNVAGLVSESDIRRLVDRFYGTVRGDDLLGPIFTQHVADWSLHLPKMYAFWSTVVLRTGRYSGRPIEAHEPLPGLTQAHFDRWLRLWAQTVTEVIHTDAQRVFVLSAERMAASMSSRLIGRN